MNTSETTVATKWILDTTHSEIKFKVRHMMITNVTGSFKEIAANIESSDDLFENSRVEFLAKTSSVDTANEQRDGHLKSPDFFDVEKFPEMKFESIRIEKKSNNEYIMFGNLTIKDVTKEVALQVEHGGVNVDPWGNTKSGFSVETKINRKDFGLNWNAALETGGVLVSDEVKIAAEIQFTKA